VKTRKVKGDCRASREKEREKKKNRERERERKRGIVNGHEESRAMKQTNTERADRGCRSARARTEGRR